MKSGLKALLLIGMGLFLYSRIFTGKLFFYINERFIWLSVLAAVGFIVVGASYRYASRQAHEPGHDGHHHNFSWGGWLLVALPIVLGLVVPPRPLGAAALTNRDVSLESLTSVASPENNVLLTTPDREKNILDWLIEFRTAGDPAAFTGQEAQLIGFVYRDDRFKSDEFMAARFVLSCCAADAAPLGLIVHWPEASSLADDQWVEVTGHFEPGEFEGQSMPFLIAETVVPTEIPNRPYLYPY